LPHTVVIGVGGNVADVLRRLQKLLIFFQRDSRVSLKRSSPIVKNPPFGFLEQEYFFNAVLVVQTTMKPDTFMRYLLGVERRFGRVRSFKNGPRTLDLDILFFDNLKIQSNILSVPHPHWQERSSVIVPLSYLVC